MDINDFRAWHTVVLMIAFLAIVWWAYSRRRKKSFDEAANLLNVSFSRARGKLIIVADIEYFRQPGGLMHDLLEEVAARGTVVAAERVASPG